MVNMFITIFRIPGTSLRATSKLRKNFIMQIVHHGKFTAYSPAPDPAKPATMVAGVLHSRNEAGLDFYALRDAISETSLIVLVKPDETTVFAASKGPLMAFPSAGENLYEIIDPPEGLTPEQALRQTLDLGTGALTPA